ncbi:hypothetical protein CU097_002133 [Rhizopus azygosporus]|uniref:Uncharacterized protein n=1 Tax=Rhizopus azygosporus TaxID=86630 RepID=A0A367IRK9_RHIAZ|nr:hypothetical protein CU097_002133 [Rhizopus azygosporus]
MKDTIFDYKEDLKKENVVYHFQPIQRLDAIKSVIIDRCKQKQLPKQTSPPIEHIGGLPSPPVEEKKPFVEEEEEEEEETEEKDFKMTCDEIKAKIQSLKDEKHRLFQLIKQMMLQEQIKKKQEQEKIQEQEEKTTRWGPPSERSNYFYSRPRYNPHPYTQHRPSRHYNSKPSPYS